MCCADRPTNAGRLSGGGYVDRCRCWEGRLSDVTSAGQVGLEILGR